MILLDTNIISEPLKPICDRRVERWLDGQPLMSLFLSAMTLAELRFGACRLPEGARRTALTQAIERDVVGAFTNRIIAFDTRCADAFGYLKAERERRGRPIAVADAAIAATALTYGLRLATRNTSDFDGLDLDLINPFEG